MYATETEIPVDEDGRQSNFPPSGRDVGSLASEI